VKGKKGVNHTLKHLECHSCRLKIGSLWLGDWGYRSMYRWRGKM